MHSTFLSVPLLILNHQSSRVDDQSIDEQTSFSLTPAANDADTAQVDLVSSLASGPAAATIDPATGRFDWTPEETDGPGSFDVTLSVSDGLFTDSESSVITVDEVNVAPFVSTTGSLSVDTEENKRS